MGDLEKTDAEFLIFKGANDLSLKKKGVDSIILGKDKLLEALGEEGVTMKKIAFVLEGSDERNETLKERVGVPENLSIGAVSGVVQDEIVKALFDKRQQDDKLVS
ncbi:MAG: hypothetical protein OEL89_04085 [Candidatus Peregrinibacteria bacterium]|nr:hypothetical protein [Candidatus Peregrinibacteria bacterium]